MHYLEPRQIYEVSYNFHHNKETEAVGLYFFHYNLLQLIFLQTSLIQGLAEDPKHRHNWHTHSHTVPRAAQ